MDESEAEGKSLQLFYVLKIKKQVLKKLLSAA